MTLPRLSGPRVALVPVPHAVAGAVCTGTDLEPVLARLGLVAGEGWPHDDTAQALRPLAEHGAEGGDGGWLVVLGHEVVGDCGWHGGPDGDGTALLAYGLAPEHRRGGLGTEAVALLVAWAEQQPGVHRLAARVLPGNEASRRLLGRLGFVEQPDDPPWLRLVRDPEQQRRPLRVPGRHVC
jgi:[ribosomal protein S5]-alanine N-acetyltransferase